MRLRAKAEPSARGYEAIFRITWQAHGHPPWDHPAGACRVPFLHSTYRIWRLSAM